MLPGEDDTNTVAKIKKIFDERYNCNLEKTDFFNHFDLIDNTNKYVIEVKNRHNNHDKYPSSMLGFNKIITGKKYIEKGYNVYFVIIFDDGIYSFKYNNENFIPKKICSRRDRGVNEINEYIFIENKLFEKLE